jgi:SAM-dependent methyltransferase
MSPRHGVESELPGWEGAAARIQTSRNYIAFGQDWNRPFLDAWLPQSGTVADVGCGQARVSTFYHRTDRPVVGVDLLESDLAAARRLSFAPFVAGDAFTLPFRSGSLAGYVGLGIAEYGPEEVVAEAHRVLAPGALLYLSVTYRNVQRRLGRKAIWRGIEVHTLSCPSVVALLERRGFTVSLVHRCSLAWGLGRLRAASRLFPAALIREDSGALSYRLLAPLLRPFANSVLVIAHKR